MLGEEETSTIKPSEKREEKKTLKKDDAALNKKDTTESIDETKEINKASSMNETEKNETKKVEVTKKEDQFNEQDEAAVKKVSKYLKTVATKMGVDDVSVNVKRDYNRVKFSIETKDAGLIIGRHGKVLNSLQTLAQIQMHQEADNKLYAKVDAENYRDRRKKTVEQLATRTAEKVKRTKRPVILEPMPAHERKQIHRYLNRFGGVQTHSEGKDPHRYLVVEPLKEEEFTL